MTNDHGRGRSDLPFSRPVAVVDVPENGLEISIAADAQERAALAAADGLLALAKLEADLKIVREGAGGVRVTGELRAKLRQTCVVSLEEFDASLVEPIDVRFAPRPEPEAPQERERPRGRKDRRAAPDADALEESRHVADLDDDGPDPLVDGRIDLGAVVAEFLALGLEPYPRKPGATFAEQEAEASRKASVSPFAGLRSALEKRRED